MPCPVGAALVPLSNLTVHATRPTRSYEVLRSAKIAFMSAAAVIAFAEASNVAKFVCVANPPYA